MYLECIEGKDVLRKNNLWYEGDSSNIYMYKKLLYKIYKREEPYRREKLDILISNYNLRDIGVLPIQKIKTNLGNYGMLMKYVPNSMTLRMFLKNNNFSIDDLMNIFIILSDNLKKVHNEDIHFSDLHHNNILVCDNNVPLYIDFDDAVVGRYGSNHICCMGHSLHEVKEKGANYKRELIKYRNLDMESLFIMFLNYILSTNIEFKNEKEFSDMVEKLSMYLPNDLLVAISSLKDLSLNVIPYEYYLGDFLKDNDTREKCKVLRRSIDGHNYF